MVAFISCGVYWCVTERYCEVCSFSEALALRLATTSAADFVTHNKRFLSEVYPNSMRIDSSNPNPQDLWNSGCQIGECSNVKTCGDLAA